MRERREPRQIFDGVEEGKRKGGKSDVGRWGNNKARAGGVGKGPREGADDNHGANRTLASGQDLDHIDRACLMRSTALLFPTSYFRGAAENID